MTKKDNLNEDFFGFGKFFSGKQNNQVVLSKKSGSEQIRQYFTQVCKLHDGGNEFPVDFDSVWPLVYSTKGNALKALISDGMFQEGIDFKIFIQNDKNSKGRPTDKYMLTVQCMEYFIARKERAVFEVYRSVFHAARKKAFTLNEDWVANSLIDTLAPIMKGIEAMTSALNERIDRLERHTSEPRTTMAGRMGHRPTRRIRTTTVFGEEYRVLADVLDYWGLRTKPFIIAQSLNRHGVEHAVKLPLTDNKWAWYIDPEGFEMLKVSRRF